MNMPKNELIVLDIAGNKARVICDSQDTREVLLLSLGFIREGDQLVRGINSQLERQGLVNELIALGALFAAGRDWSPSELVDYYRDQGFVRQNHRIITWKSPDNYVICSSSDSVKPKRS